MHLAKMAAAASHHWSCPRQQLIMLNESDSASTLLKPKEFARNNPSHNAIASIVTTSAASDIYLQNPAMKFPLSSRSTPATEPATSSGWN